jgi:hypothetical protein
METTAKRTILRIELWHALLLGGLLLLAGRTKLIDPSALLIGGVFMGINFLLLGFGVASVLTSLAGKGRVKVGVGLLALKIVVFLGLLSMLFFRFDLDAVSFALGFSTLIVAILLEAARKSVSLGVL